MSPSSNAPLHGPPGTFPGLSRILECDQDPTELGEAEANPWELVAPCTRRRGTDSGRWLSVRVEEGLTRGEVWNRGAVHASGTVLWFGRGSSCTRVDSERIARGDTSVVVRGTGPDTTILVTRTLWRLHPWPHADEPIAPWLAHLREEGIRVVTPGSDADVPGGTDRPTLLEASTSLRILHVVHGFPEESHAGTEIACQTLAQAQREAGHVVRIFARSADPEREEYSSFREEVDGLVVDRVVHHLHHPGGIRDTFVNAAVERVFRRTLVEFRPDVVHVHHLIHLSAPILALARRAGAVTGVTWHDYWPLCPRVQLLRPDGVRCRPRRPLACLLCVKGRATRAIPVAHALAPLVERPILNLVGRLWRTPRGNRLHSDLANLRRRARRLERLYSNVDFAFAPSRHLASVVGASWKGAATPIRVIENALRPERFAGRRASDSGAGHPLRLGFFGSLVEHKGIDVLLRALAGFESLDVALHVHGGFEPERKPFHARLRELARGAPVTFHGRYANEDVAERLGSVDVVCLPSQWAENSPIVCLEAAAMGVPILAPRLGGFPEKIEHGVDGWLYEPSGGARALRRAIENLVETHRRGAITKPIPRLRGAAEQAAEVEVYYRLARRSRRPPGVRVVAERWGAHPDGLEGLHEVQGTDLLLLRPDCPGRVAYRWEPDETTSLERSFQAEVEIELLLLGGEHDVPVGGRVYFNDRLCEEMEPRRAGHRDEVRVHRFPVRVNGTGSSIVIENTVHGRPVFTRVRRVRIVRPRPESTE